MRTSNVLRGGVDRNESAASFVWLARALGQLPDATGPVVEAWIDTRDRMRRPNDQNIVYGVDWISDPWLAKAARRTVLGTVAPYWSPPDRLDNWPTYEVAQLIRSVGFGGQRTNYQGMVDLLATTPPGIGDIDAVEAIGRFVAMDSEIANHGDVRMVQTDQVRAWLATSVGRLLLGVMLTPGVESKLLADATMARLRIPSESQFPAVWVGQNFFGEKYLELLYNLKMTQAGVGPLELGNIRIGQSEEWRQDWDWLSRPIGFDDVREALQVAARIMRCGPVVAGLLQVLWSGDSPMRVLSLAVMRRWLLTLKAMTWLEAALSEEWTYVRAQDLACFAFNAVKPDWPRRIIAVSHRSVDAKPLLIQMNLWGSSHFALDASYVPSWETNTGMVWGLFGATPAIVRVGSPGYGQSIWCLREAELAQHLIERRDFLSERWVMDVELSELGSLDAAIDTFWNGAEDPNPIREFTREFPPFCEVWTPSPMSVFEVRMLRAAAALRVINTFVTDPQVTNMLAEGLLYGNDPPIPAPTNNPGGWRQYASIFEDLSALCTPERELAIRLPPGYGTEQAFLDNELLERVPDLSSGKPAIGDLLVAFEWLRTEWPLLVESRRGRFLAVSCRELSPEQWAVDERLSLQRGLLAIRTPVPIWIIQQAGQGVENWGLPGADHPIFTEHVSSQFSWMQEAFLDRQEMQARFPVNSGLEFSATLEQRCREGDEG
jgi:hypothetical protein